MAVIMKKVVDNDCILGIWEVAENFDTLISKIKLKGNDKETLNNFMNNNRKLEWLSVRTLLKELSNSDIGIVYNSFKKPYLSDNSSNISISHSHKFTSILMSKKRRVGIDLEFMSHRITNIAHKFINDKEYITSDKEKEKYHLYIHWCSKEALYKICDKQELNFKTNIFLEPFEPQDSGEINGTVKRTKSFDIFLLKYFKLDNYIVAWCVK